MVAANQINLHVIVSCTDRKRAAAGAPVRLRDVPSGGARERCSRWWKLVSASRGVQARDLYAGDHWAVARTLPEVARCAGLAERVFRPGANGARCWVSRVHG